jgi:hypothetical protein
MIEAGTELKRVEEQNPLPFLLPGHRRGTGMAKSEIITLRPVLCLLIFPGCGCSVVVIDDGNPYSSLHPYGIMLWL